MLVTLIQNPGSKSSKNGELKSILLATFHNFPEFSGSTEVARHEKGVAAENRDTESLVGEAPGKDEGSHLSPLGGHRRLESTQRESPAAL